MDSPSGVWCLVSGDRAQWPIPLHAGRTYGKGSWSSIPADPTSNFSCSYTCLYCYIYLYLLFLHSPELPSHSPTPPPKPSRARAGSYFSSIFHFLFFYVVDNKLHHVFSVVVVVVYIVNHTVEQALQR